MTTAASYALSGYVQWELAAVLILGGFGGTQLGILLGRRLAGYKGLLERIFAVVVLLVGTYVIMQGIYRGA